MRTIPWACLLFVLVPFTASAQNTEPKTTPPPKATNPTSEPAPKEQSVAPSPVAAKTDPEEPATEAEPRTRSYWALGATGVFWEKYDDPSFGQPAPALTLHGTTTRPITDHISVMTSMRIMFHDWEAMGDAYEWMVSPVDTDDESKEGTYSALKIAVLIPGFFVVPFGAANYSAGGGLTFYTSPTSPSLFLDIGVQMGMMLRPSDSDFIIDMGVGAFGGVGFEITDHFALISRIDYEVPFFRWVFAETAAIPAVSGTLSLAYVSGD